MAIQDTSKIKEDIIQFLENSGPSLPVPISRHIKVDSLFASAFLSELLSNKKLKITNMKVGGSPVYYVQGTEKGLEKYSEYLKSKEKEAYELLKENNFLEDEPQHPAIRVALRNIKDFAKPFEKDGKIIWRYFLIPEEEYKKEKEEPKKEETVETKLPASFVSSVQKSMEENNKQEKIDNSPKEENKISKTEEKETELPIKTNPEPKKEEPKREEIKETPKQNQENNSAPKELERIIPSEEKNTFLNPLAKKEEPKKTKEKPKSEFVQKTINYINSKGWKIIQELDYKAKEYNCLVQINSDLGPIIFKTQAKDKKSISEADFTKLLGDSQAIPLPALMLSFGEPQKKTQDFLEKYASVLKFKKIE
jgi:hypothetical protein